MTGGSRTHEPVEPRIVILIPYFGEWPVWIELFLESCRANASIDWILFGDAHPPENRPKNVRFVSLSFAEYKQQLSDRLGERLDFPDPYKLCDLKPALPFVHADLVQDFEFAGFGDLDVIYGNIRRFYDANLLSRYDLLSTHADRVSGHFCIMRNREDLVTAFRRAPGWKAAVRSHVHSGFDERGFFNLFRGPKGRLLERLGVRRVRCLFQETHSTPRATDRTRWFWKNGRLSDDELPGAEFMYLHFMNWHSERWYADQHVAPGTAAPWRARDQLVRIDWRDARRNGFMVSSQGFEPLPAGDPSEQRS